MAVTNAEFKRHFEESTGLHKIFNFYGMVEQVGSVFLEGEDGYLYPPNFADVIIRDSVNWEEGPGRQQRCDPGRQLASAQLSRSFAAHRRSRYCSRNR